MTKANETSLRRDLIQTCLSMKESGLTFGTSGNASVRLDAETLLITPTGVAYDELQAKDIVTLKYDGTYYGPKPPSSEWRFHRDILTERDDINAIVHTHSPFATALACRMEAIPAFHYMIAVAGGADIRCAPYATFGTQALSEHVLEALAERLACLMANHGQIALGTDLKSALNLSGEVENLSAMYWRSKMVGEPDLLDSQEMVRVIEKFKTYGTDQEVDSALTHGGDHPPE